MLHLEAERRLVADRLHAVDVAVRHLHQEALRRDERLLAFDAEPDLAVLDDPPHPCIRVEAARRPGAWRHRDVVGMQRVVADDRLGPVLPALVLVEQLRQPPVRLVRRRPRGGLHGDRCPGERLARSLPAHDGVLAGQRRADAQYAQHDIRDSSRPSHGCSSHRVRTRGRRRAAHLILRAAPVHQGCRKPATVSPDSATSPRRRPDGPRSLPRGRHREFRA